MSDEAEEFQEEQEQEEQSEEQQQEVYEPEVDDHGDTETDRERARLGGWKPQDEANLPEGKWRSAKEFNEVGKRAPEVLKENDLMFAEIQKLNRQVEQMSQNQFDMVAEARRSERTKTISELEETKRKAVEEADTESYDRADQAVKRELRGAQEDEQKFAPQQQVTYDPVFIQWKSQPENAWYDTDPQKKAFADQYSQKLAASNPAYATNTMMLYQDVARAVEQAFTAQPQKPAASKTETNGRPSRKPGKAKEKGFGDLDRAAKAAWESQKNMKVGGKLVFANKEEFAKKYFASYGD